MSVNDVNNALRRHNVPVSGSTATYSFGSTIPFCAWYFPLRSR